MYKNQYVILTGGKNNAGDYLIKYRAKELLRSLRPDREIVDYQAWLPFSTQQLIEINSSRALILCGGPALQNMMRPTIYPMVKDISQIKVPIIMMGLGQKSPTGTWTDTYNYKLNKETHVLLRIIEKNGYLSSVRDYHSLNVLRNLGYFNVLMTGCPGLYDLNYINTPIVQKEIKKVSFSAGVCFAESVNMEKLQKECISKLRDYFTEADFNVVFHHSIDKNIFLTRYGKLNNIYYKQKELSEWLDDNNINHVDISGSEQNLINHYSFCDLHVGFRVHAHIFMNSISKPSVLISEDSRGKALKDVISGMIFDGYADIKPRMKVCRVLHIRQDRYVTNNNLPNDLMNNINYELTNRIPRFAITRKNIDAHFDVMKRYLAQLP
jgi:hypothetical protein